MENETKEELVQAFPGTGELMTTTAADAAGTGNSPAVSAADEPVQRTVPVVPADGAGEEDREEREKEMEKLRAELEEAHEQVQQLERERWLLSQGVPEEDLDYCVFKIGALVTPEKDFAAAAKEFLKQRRARQTAGISTAAGLGGRSTRPPTVNETMNRIIRGM